MDVCSARLIALDWGTSSLHAYRLGDSGSILEARVLPLGIMNLAQLLEQSANENTETIFRRAFEKACGDWIRTLPPATPIIASGMIGSAQGWREAPYLQVPINITHLATSLMKIDVGDGRVIHIVPGLIEHSELPNIMRGEETQVVGVLNLIKKGSPNHETGNELLIGMPGTHSKWIFVQDNTIMHFETFMTGEVYTALGSHTILSRTARPAATPDYGAFDRGVRVARSPAGNAGLLSTIFTARSLALTGVLSPEQQPDYLSGLLVGSEIAALLRPRITETHPRVERHRSILLVGDAALCTRYIRALADNGWGDVQYVTNATERGLWELAVQARLVS
jgi:2-dehydro-3-deoxygalactonokinase